MKQKFPYGIAVLLTCIGIVAGILFGYLLFNHAGSESGNLNAFDNLVIHDHEWTQVPQSVTDSNIKAYRQSLAFANLSLHPKGKSYGIVHEPETAVDYDNNVFPQFVKSHTPRPGYKWSVGFYPEVCRDAMHDGSTRPRISVFMIPTMRNTDIKGHPLDIIDYYATRSTTDSLYYLPDSIRNKSREEINRYLMGSGGSPSYDQGTIFP